MVSGMIESVNDAQTIDEMLSEINRMQFYDPMVKNVIHMANARGLSDKDMFIALSYYSLRDRAEIRKQMLLTLQNQQVETVNGVQVLAT